MIIWLLFKWLKCVCVFVPIGCTMYFHHGELTRFKSITKKFPSWFKPEKKRTNVQKSALLGCPALPTYCSIRISVVCSMLITKLSGAVQMNGLCGNSAGVIIVSD